MSVKIRISYQHPHELQKILKYLLLYGNGAGNTGTGRQQEKS